MIKHALLLVFAAASASACCGSGDETPITSASLDGWSEGGFAVIGGFASGSSTLTTTDSAGQSQSTGVSLGGPVFGIVFEMHGSGEGLPDCGGLTLTIPDGGVTEDELFEMYTGSATQVGLAFGISEHDLENGAGVRIKGGAMTVGMGMFVGFEWMGLSKD